MKKIFTSVFCFLTCLIAAKAQPNLYTLTYSGSSQQGGTILNYKPATNTAVAVKKFERPGYNAGNSSPVLANNGKFYSITIFGGDTYAGTIFSYDPSNGSYAKLHDFDSPSGDNPQGGLIRANDGMLYGVTETGGTKGKGVIFSFSPSNSVYTVVYNFLDDTHGSYPLGGLVQASDGKLYGTALGGANGYGVIFSFDPSNSVYTVVRNLGPYDAGSSDGSMVQASDGKLYGMISNAGSGKGVIFSLDPASAVYSIVYSFDGTTGSNPNGSLIQASDGNLYGMTHDGGTNGDGVIFSLNPGNSVYTVLYNFDGTNGAFPYGSLMQATDGNLYGMAHDGGTNGKGVLFSFDPNTSAYTDLHNFSSTNGAPQGGLVQTSDGKLYGSISNSYDMVFSFDPANSAYTVFQYNNIDGIQPQGSAVQASDGKLYGMTWVGGNSGSGNGNGIIFSFDPANSAYTILHNFDDASGSHPFGSLMQASDGRLYGMAYDGGSNQDGVLFSFDPASSTYTVLHNFDYTSGASPVGDLIQASDGKLYGMTSEGGSAIFCFDPVSLSYTVLHSFNLIDDAYGSLIQTSDGKLCGMAKKGGANGKGVIFSLNPSGATYTVLYNFDNTNGASPQGTLVQASDGKLYGMTTEGGTNGKGVVFSFNPSGAIYTVLYNFDNTNGASPLGSLAQASDGKLYAMTSKGGSNGLGIIFSIDPGTAVFTKLKDLDDNTGGNPMYSSFIDLSRQKIKTPALANAATCPGSALQIPFTIQGSFINGNIFTAQLSDASGSFDAPISIGVIASTTATPIHAIIPPNTLPGAQYRIRVVSSAPVIRTDNGTNITVNAVSAFYPDADGDGYGTGSKVNICVADANTPPPGYSLNNTDCNDNDATVWQSASLYVDKDGDGYDNGQQTVCYGAAIPSGYSLTTKGTDHDDNNSTAWQSGLLYIDKDGDGYDNGQQIVEYGDTPPAGYSLTTNGTDYNDNDPTVWQSASLYIDKDGDGYDNGQQTVGYGATIPAGYSLTTNGTDYDDNNPAVWQSALLYIDKDGDGYDEGQVTVAYGATIPAGYSLTTNGPDYDDNNPGVWQSASLYIDKDGDGYDNGQEIVSYGATIPAGYSLTTSGTDCDDNNAAVHAAPVAGTISGATPICPRTSVFLSLNGNSAGNIQWQLSSDNLVFTDINGAQGTDLNATLTSTTYFQAVVSNGTCTATTPSVAVVVNPLPITDIATAPTVIANSAGNTASVVDGGSGTSYAWTITNGSITAGSGTNNITYAAGASGTVTLAVTVTNSYQCSMSSGSKLVTITVSNCPAVTVAAQSYACSGSTGNVASVANAGKGATYAWSITNGTITAGSNSSCVTYTAGTSGSVTLSVTVTNKSGCKSISPAKVVTINPLPDATITTPASVCGNSTGNIASVPDAGSGACYSWNISNGTISGCSSSSTIKYKAGSSGTVTLWVTVINKSGCKITSAKKLVPIAAIPSASITAASSACSASLGNTASVASAGSGASYAWSITNGTISSGSTGNSITYTAGTSGSVTLSVTVTNSAGCQSSSSAKQVKIVAIPVASITAAASVCSGSTGNTASVASAGSGASYAWVITNGTISGSSTGSSIKYKAATSGAVTLSVTVTNSGGCQVTSSKQVPVTATVVPSFAQIGPICTNSKAPVLPSQSNNGITGTWSPSKISTTSASSATYTFTPAVGQCASSATMKIVVQKCTNGISSTNDAEQATTSIVESNNVKLKEGCKPVTALYLEADLRPNPTQSSFQLTVTGNRTEPVEVHVFDITGRSMGRAIKMKIGETIRFGDTYPQGVYIIEIIQGPERKALKGIKQ